MCLEKLENDEEHSEQPECWPIEFNVNDAYLRKCSVLHLHKKQKKDIPAGLSRSLEEPEKVDLCLRAVYEKSKNKKEF